MLQSSAFANAAAIVAGLYYTVCLVLTLVAPDVTFNLFQAMFHGLNLQPIRATDPLNLGGLTLGLITFMISTWVTAYALIEVYNKLAKK